jgi:hypothetical protein
MAFCSQRNYSTGTPSVGAVINFLTIPFLKGLGYSTINTARSALSSCIITDEKQPIGKHPLVVRFMKGVYNDRPALPKNVLTWNTNIVLNYLKTLTPMKQLTLKDLTLKAVMLTALLTGQRTQTLSYLDIRNMSCCKTYYKFRIGDLLKQSRPGYHQKELELPAYPHDERLRIVTVLDEYLDRTQNLEAQ